VYADQALRVLSSDRGGRQLGKILESLALLRAEGNLPLQGLVEAQARHLPRGSTLVMITSSAADAVYQTADVLMRRGLRPVVVLVDGATFGGYFSVEKLAVSLKSLGIPTCRIVEGDDLGAVLSTAASSPSWS